MSTVTGKGPRLGAHDLVRLFRALFQTSPDGVVIARPEGAIIHANPAACRMLGRTEEQICRLGRSALVVDDDRLRRFLAERDATGVAHGEVVHRRADGSTYVAEVTSALVPATGGEVYTYVIFSDVSEQRRTREALHRYELLAEHSRDVIMFFRRCDGRVLDANAAATSTYGYTRDELMQLSVRDLRAQPTHEELAAQMADADVRGIRFETTHRRKDGSTFPVEVSSEGADVEGTRVLISVIRDISERRRLESEREESEKRFRDMADNIPQLAWMAEPDGSVFWYNRRWYDYTGMAPDRMRGWGWRHVHHPDHIGAVMRKWAAGIASRIAWEDTFPLRRHDGEYRWFLSRALPIKDERGNVLRWFGTNTDVTEQREGAQRLADADRRKSEFIGVLSHELRNPLAPIRNSLAILDRVAPESAEALKAREVIHRQTRHLTRLVDDLLDVNRISSGKIELRRARIDLRDVARRACDDHRSLFEERELDLRFDEPSGPVFVDADPTRIAQVVGNLLQNASKFSDPGARTTVTVHRRDSQAEVRVRDTGIGIEPREIERMFEPFVQAENSLARTRGGLGLGLAVVKGLVELHGGSVSGHSEGPGRGAEFVVRLPLAEPLQTAELPKRGKRAPRSRAVLVVEDNADAGETLKDLLEIGGHRVWLAADGRAAVALARQHRPEVVICDIGLPDMSGYEVARVIREDPALDACWLVALTGYAQPEDRDRAAEAGFDAHLAKPPSIDALDEAIDGKGERLRR
jgi:PAS domain S-box-containing protein